MRNVSLFGEVTDYITSLSPDQLAVFLENLAEEIERGTEQPPVVLDVAATLREAANLVWAD